jgi:hypothetical protein
MSGLCVAGVAGVATAAGSRRRAFVRGAATARPALGAPLGAVAAATSGSALGRSGTIADSIA